MFTSTYLHQIKPAQVHVCIPLLYSSSDQTSQHGNHFFFGPMLKQLLYSVSKAVSVILI